MSKSVEGNKNLYAECDHLQQNSKPVVHVTEEIAKEFGRNYRVLPLFEKGLYDYVSIGQYSLQRNELLRCRWAQYKKHIEERVFAPFQFPCSRDLHFYNGCIRFMASESIFRFPENRMKLKPGPGVDFRGQVPIPQELLMTRGSHEKQDRSGVRKVKKGKTTDGKK